MAEFDLILKNGHILEYNPSAPHQVTIEKKDVGVFQNKIKALGDLSQSQAKEVYNAEGLHILPGLIDTQVHFREPGLEYKENLRSGTRAALLGGVTAVFEMPNTTPSTTTEESFLDKIHRAQNTAFCDFAFYMGAAHDNLEQLHDLENLPGCCGIKVFLGSSTGSLLLSDPENLKKLSKSGKKRIAAHCEDENTLKDNFQKINPHQVFQHPLWRSEESALKATTQWTQFCIESQRPTHVLHITSKSEMDYLKNAKTLGPISVEVTPQHLTLSSPNCYEELGSKAQMNPPIRSIEHQQRLWQGLAESTVDIIGSDHAPHTLEEKQRPYPQSPSGMPGVQTLLPIMLNHVHNGKLKLEHLVQLLSVNPVQLFNIKNQGLLQLQQKANFTIVDLKKKHTIEDQWIESKCGWTPFHKKEVTGWPVATILNGQVVMQDNKILVDNPCGQMLEFT